MITLLNIDCMEYMATVPDKYFDLAIVDPPYGGGQHFNFRFGTDEAVYENIAPDNIYFEELRRISKDQIVWGGNYFTHALPVNRYRYRDWETDRKSTRLNSSHSAKSRMPSSA